LGKIAVCPLCVAAPFFFAAAHKRCTLDTFLLSDSLVLSRLFHKRPDDKHWVRPHTTPTSPTAMTSFPETRNTAFIFFLAVLLIGRKCVPSVVRNSLHMNFLIDIVATACLDRAFCSLMSRKDEFNHEWLIDSSSDESQSDDGAPSSPGTDYDSCPSASCGATEPHPLTRNTRRPPTRLAEYLPRKTVR
jgi:hypothetical protein